MRTSQKKQALKSNIWKGYAYRFLSYSIFTSGVLIPFYTVWGGISFFQVMVLQAVFIFTSFLFEVPTGAFADRFGRKASLVLAGVVAGLATLVYGSYPDFWVFVGAEFLWGVGHAFASGAREALVYDSLRELEREKESKQIFGRWESIGLSALILAAPLGSLIAKYVGLREVMLVTAIPMLLSGLLALSFKEPAVERKRARRGYLETLAAGISYLRDHKILKILTVDCIAIHVPAFFLIWVYQVVLQRLQMDLGYFGFVHALLVFGQILVLNSLGRLEWLAGGKRRYLFFSALLSGAAYVLMAVVWNPWVAVLGISLVGAFGITRKTLLGNYMNKFIDSEIRATVLSAIAMLLALTTALTNLLLGYLVEWNLTYTLLGLGGFMLFMAILSEVKEEHLLD